MGEICGAHNRLGGPCRRPAGWGTKHVGTGRCKLHGGASTGAPGNQNALKTGEHEAIWLDALDDDEQALYHQADTDVARQLDQEIRLTEIRERRMLMRIAALKERAMTVVEKTQEQEREDRKLTSSTTRSRSRGTLGQIQEIEEALTRVQERKARLLELKHKIEAEKGPAGANVQEYVDALNHAGSDVWADERPDEDGDGA